MRVCEYACMRVCEYACMRVCEYVCAHMRKNILEFTAEKSVLYACVYNVCVCVCVYIYIYIYIYKYTHTHQVSTGRGSFPTHDAVTYIWQVGGKEIVPAHVPAKTLPSIEVSSYDLYVFIHAYVQECPCMHKSMYLPRPCLP